MRVQTFHYHVQSRANYRMPLVIYISRPILMTTIAGIKYFNKRIVKLQGML